MTIIVLWILLALIALIVILLHFSVYAYVRLDDDGFYVKVKYLFFTIYPREEKKIKEKKIKSKKEKKVEISQQEFEDNIDDDFEVTETETTVEETVVEEKVVTETQYEETKPVENKKQPKKTEKVQPEKSEKKSKWQELKEKYYKIKPYLPMGWKYFKKLLKAIRITDLKINIDVGREDAHEAVIYYGSVQGVLFNTLAVLASIFTMKIKRANVNCVFAKNIIDGNGECYIRVRPSTVIAIAFCVAVNFGITYLKQRKIKKSEENKLTENKLEVS